MHSEHASANVGYPNKPAELGRPTRPLDRIEDEAGHVRSIAARVKGFLDRFHGVQPVSGSTPPAPAIISYDGHLEELALNLDHLDKLVSELEMIG